MTLREYLSIPFILSAESVIRKGDWVRIVSYPELPGCQVEGAATVLLIDELDIKRTEYIFTTLRAGKTPPVPRPALPYMDVEGLLERLGLKHIIPFLDKVDAVLPTSVE
ncbi:hypothetical protein NZD89_17970 [Alicyclobacillus fastidiosus]|uniref:Type II toxin-antitoxin system HicB family antitoxin n=1 Tax=Alicyclobacillus fastidiosus TaxID=392011 RepID=A0ABY6ZDP3_9BACL|nr:hypothetical protein [Alicyclobacillus fastidiosus]WAH40250.1 hypothetical protein NZD89_17970 [Alicyclobacillus fastidiosus]GMA61618.1 hypothetical protein GCM10025859_20580 [Alicyclobacillus fastidiosus]